MIETQLIVEVLGQTFDGRAWHGPSFMDVLKGVDRMQAGKRPIEARHTIWEIVNHCSYWMETVTKALHGKKMPDFISTENWSQMGETDEDWAKTLERLKAAYRELVNSIKDFDTSLFTKEISGSFNGQSYAIKYRKMLHGVSDHNTYHAGQIAFLRTKTA